MPTETTTTCPKSRTSDSHDGPPPLIRADMAAEFALDPTIDFLNHGCFGARPKAVVEAQQKRRAEFESRPIHFLDRVRKEQIDRAKQSLGRFLDMQPENFGFVTNATGGVNAVLRSLTFKPGDELLTTNHVYNAVRKTMQHVAAHATGGAAKYIELDIPLPLKSQEEITKAIEAALSPRTQLVVIDHITSPTAVIFPVERIVKLCNARGIDVLIDGAHAPGMIPLNIEAIGAAYYAGNLHKWVCAPVGAAFLHVRQDKQKSGSGVHPTTISHFLDESFVNEFNWQGTRDITSWLCVEDALQYFETFGDTQQSAVSGQHSAPRTQHSALGFVRVMRHNHDFAVWVQRMLCERWKVEPATPLDGSMIGSMATVTLPGQAALRKRFKEFLNLRYWLYDEHKIEAAVIEWPGPQGLWRVRPCCQVYNRPEQYERLSDAILEATR